MSVNIIKYPAEEGNFSAVHNRANIVLPGNTGVYDLSKSYININVSANVTSNTDAQAVYAPMLVLNESGRNGGKNRNLVNRSPAVLVKHCSVISQAKGKIESIRHVDALREGLALYEKDRSSLKQDLGQLCSARTEQHFTKGGMNEIYSQLHTNNLSQSRNKSQDLRIDLKDLFGFGVVDAYDSGKYGSTKIHLECNFDKLATQLSIGAADPWGTEYRTGGATMGAFQNVAQNNTGSPVDVFTIKSTAVYSTPEDSPFFTGQLLTVTSTTGAAQGTEHCRIQSIESTADGEIQLTFASKVRTVANGNSLTGISVIQKAPDTQTVEINGVELVAYRREDMDSGPSEIQFLAYNSDFDSYAPTQALNRQYYLPPNTLNAFVMFPSPIYSMEAITDYRFSINNVPTTNRAIEVKSGLHYDNLMKTFINAGSQVRDFGETYDDFSGNSNVDGTKQGAIILATPVPVSGSMSQFGLEINASADLTGNHCIYSQHIKKV